MAKIILLLVLFGGLLFVAAWVVLVKYFGLWGFLAPLFILPLLLWLAKIALAHQCRRLITTPFRLKGAVLREAEATVHSVSHAPPPGSEAYADDPDLDLEDSGDFDADSIGERSSERDEFVREQMREDAKRNWYYVDVTITPKAPAADAKPAPFQHWDPMDLTIAKHDARPETDDDDDLCQIVHVHVQRDGTWEELEDNCDGPERIRLHVGLQPGPTALTFQYYLELFGDLTVPENDHLRDTPSS